MTRATVRLHLAFAGMGATAAAIPAILPTAQATLGDAVLAGPPVLFLGLLLGVGTAALVRTGSSPVRVVAAGALVQALAASVAAFSSLPVLFVIGAGVAGFGFGLTESAGGVTARAIASVTTAGTLTRLITTTSATAAATPLLVWMVSSAHPHTLSVLLGPAALNACAGVLVAGMRVPPVSAERAAPSVSAPTVVVVVAAVAAALYVGVESLLSGWSSAIPFHLLRIDSSTAALGTSAFWILITLGRALASGALRAGLTPGAVLGLGGAAASSALLTAALVGEPVVVVALLAVALVLIAPTYGLILGTVLDQYPRASAARVSSLVIAGGACGGAIVPLTLVGVGIGPGDPAAIAVCAAGVAALTVLVFVSSFIRTPSKRSVSHG